jgi:hypothetical protein
MMALGEETMRLLILLLVFAHPALAQDDPAKPDAAPPKPCSSDKHGQFDFWVGDWSVSSGEQIAGTNRIEKRHDGCVLAEHWISAKGNFTGSSLNTYDAATDRWHQTWADSSGTLLQLDGHFEDGQMVLQGTRPGAAGAVVTHEISWTPNPDGTVRQLWRTRSGEAAWNTLFDGLYTRTVTE